MEYNFMTFFAVCFIIFALYKTCLKDRQDRNQLTININMYINQNIHMASPNIMAHGGDGVQQGADGAGDNNDGAGDNNDAANWFDQQVSSSFLV